MGEVLSPAELRAMTLSPAAGERFGSIVPGRAADLVIWDGDPPGAHDAGKDGRHRRGVSRASRLRDRSLDLAKPTPFGSRPCSLLLDGVYAPRT